MPTATKAKTTESPKTTAKTGTARNAGGSDAAERAADLAGKMLEQVKNGGTGAIDSVRSFVGKVDSTLPTGEGPSRGRDIVDSALEMSQEIVQKEYEALRGIVDSAGKSLSASKR